jgi:hypothetical protein
LGIEVQVKWLEDKREVRKWRLPLPATLSKSFLVKGKEAEWLKYIRQWRDYNCGVL